MSRLALTTAKDRVPSVLWSPSTLQRQVREWMWKGFLRSYKAFCAVEKVKDHGNGFQWRDVDFPPSEKQTRRKINLASILKKKQKTKGLQGKMWHIYVNIGWLPPNITAHLNGYAKVKTGWHLDLCHLSAHAESGSVCTVVYSWSIYQSHLRVMIHASRDQMIAALL